MTSWEGESTDRISGLYVRALTGAQMSEKMYYSHALPAKITELVRRYGIRRVWADVTPMSATQAEGVLAASNALLTELGLFCTDTQRLLPLSQEEIEAGLARAPAGYVQGSGAEMVHVFSRDIEDLRVPSIDGGPLGVRLSRETFAISIRAAAGEDIQGVSLGLPTPVLGDGPCPGLLACGGETISVREALRAENKPGLSVLGVLPPEGILPLQGGAAHDRLQSADRLTVEVVPRLKLDFGSLSKMLAIAGLSHGLIAGSSIWPEESAGDPIAWAVCVVAEALATFAIFDVLAFAFSPLRPKSDGSSGRIPIWVASTAHLAFAMSGRKVVTGSLVIGAAGPATDMLAFEIASQVVAATASGCSTFLCAVGNGGRVLDHASAMEARILVETARAAAAMSLSDAQESTREILGHYEADLAHGAVPFGKSFQECHDLGSHRPTDETETWWDNCKKALAAHGLTA